MTKTENILPDNAATETLLEAILPIEGDFQASPKEDDNEKVLTQL